MVPSDDIQKQVSNMRNRVKFFLEGLDKEFDALEEIITKYTTEGEEHRAKSQAKRKQLDLTAPEHKRPNLPGEYATFGKDGTSISFSREFIEKERIAEGWVIPLFDKTGKRIYFRLYDSKPNEACWKLNKEGRIRVSAIAEEDWIREVTDRENLNDRRFDIEVDTSPEAHAKGVQYYISIK